MCDIALKSEILTSDIHLKSQLIQFRFVLQVFDGFLLGWIYAMGIW